LVYEGIQLSVDPQRYVSLQLYFSKTRAWGWEIK